MSAEKTPQVTDPRGADDSGDEIQRLFGEATQALDARNCWQAIDLVNRGLQLDERAGLGASERKLDLLSTKRQAEIGCGRRTSAEGTLRDEIATTSALLGADDPSVLWRLGELARMLALDGNFEKARALCAERSARAQRATGSRSVAAAEAALTCAGVAYRECDFDQVRHYLEQALAACDGLSGCASIRANVALWRSGVLMRDERSVQETLSVVEDLVNTLQGSPELRWELFPEAEERLAGLYRATGRATDARRVLEHAWKFVVGNETVWERQRAHLALLLHDLYESEGDRDSARALNRYSEFMLSSRVGSGDAGTRLDPRAIAAGQSAECRVTKAEWVQRDHLHGQALLAIHRKLADCFGSEVLPETRMADFLMLVDSEGRVARATVVGVNFRESDLECMLGHVATATLPIQDRVPRLIEFSHSPDAPNARP